MESCTISLWRDGDMDDLHELREGDDEEGKKEKMITVFADSTTPEFVKKLLPKKTYLVKEEDLASSLNEKLKEFTAEPSPENDLVVLMLSEIINGLRATDWYKIVFGFELVFEEPSLNEERLEKILEVKHIRNLEDEAGVLMVVGEVIDYLNEVNSLLLLRTQSPDYLAKVSIESMQNICRNLDNFRVNLYEIDLYFIAVNFWAKFGNQTKLLAFLKNTTGIENNLENGAAKLFKESNHLSFYDFLSKQGLYEVILKDLIKKVDEFKDEFRESSYAFLKLACLWEQKTKALEKDIFLQKVEEAKNREKELYVEKMRNVLLSMLTQTSLFNFVWGEKFKKVKQKFILMNPKERKILSDSLISIAEISKDFLCVRKEFQKLDPDQQYLIYQQIDMASIIVQTTCQNSHQKENRRLKMPNLEEQNFSILPDQILVWVCKNLKLILPQVNTKSFLSVEQKKNLESLVKVNEDLKV